MSLSYSLPFFFDRLYAIFGTEERSSVQVVYFSHDKTKVIMCTPPHSNFPLLTSLFAPVCLGQLDEVMMMQSWQLWVSLPNFVLGKHTKSFSVHGHVAGQRLMYSLIANYFHYTGAPCTCMCGFARLIFAKTMGQPNCFQRLLRFKSPLPG